MNSSSIEIEEAEQNIKIPSSNTSPLTNSTDISESGLAQLPSFEKIDIEKPSPEPDRRALMNIEEILQSVLSKTEISAEKKDFKSYLIYKIQQLSKLTETYFEASKSKTKYRGFLDNQPLISKIKSKRERKNRHQEFSEEFEDHINTLKAAYSDEEPLYDMIDRFSDNFTREANSFLNSIEPKDKKDQAEPIKAPRGRPKSADSKKLEKVSKKKDKQNKKNEKAEIVEEEKKQPLPTIEVEAQVAEGSTRRKRNLSKPNYCEEEKITKKTKRATSENKTIKAPKPKKEEKAKAKTIAMIKTELNIKNLVTYTWRECEIHFNLLLSKLSEHELITFFRRLAKDFPECICFAGQMIQLKIGTSNAKPGEYESRIDRMKTEIKYYYIFAQYIEKILSFNEIPNLEEDEN